MTASDNEVRDQILPEFDSQAQHSWTHCWYHNRNKRINNRAREGPEILLDLAERLCFQQIVLHKAERL